MAGEKLVFRRVSSASNPSPAEIRSGGFGGVFRTLFGSLKGTVKVAQGVNLTDPTGEVWDADKGRL
jgi:hypothetical protein